ncbi:sensor histidine kinase [Cupriavidus sp. 2TAF22]|uniref:sensor histidine kinase n=1 Tax=unclassified Cupriavidus TaxID=2640874 RepID=UPI003F8EC937
MRLPLFQLVLRADTDVVLARQAARSAAATLGFSAIEQTAIATTVSELARLLLSMDGPRTLCARLIRGEGREHAERELAITVDAAPAAIATLARMLRGEVAPGDPSAQALLHAVALADSWSLEEEGTARERLAIHRRLPASAPESAPAALAALSERCLDRAPDLILSELREQNRELAGTLHELAARQRELELLANELADTNRGVVALYAELDDRADRLRVADETKSRFLSNVSHELRTPLSSIRALSGLLLDQTDGPLNAEQVHQVTMVRHAAESLAQLVDDLLDLAKIASGKTELSLSDFTLDNTFSALRGMMRPLQHSAEVELMISAVDHIPPLHTDEGKLAQILRNFVSNALKYTEHGEVRVGAQYLPATDQLVVTVADTGIGIAPGHLPVVFEEFTQIANPLQHRVKGTGLGLPLCRQLADLLHGKIHVQSEVGKGSIFTLMIPAHCPARARPAAASDAQHR